MPVIRGTWMQKEVFSPEEERQIRAAFDADDADLGINNLDSAHALESVFNRVDQKLAAKARKRNVWNFGFSAPRRISSIGSVLASPIYGLLSVAMVIGLAVTVTLQSLEINSLKTPLDPFRGSTEVFQLVETPLEDAQALLNLVILQGISASVMIESPDRVKVIIPVNEKTIQLMLSRRIELPKAEYCTIIFEKI